MSNRYDSWDNEPRQGSSYRSRQGSSSSRSSRDAVYGSSYGTSRGSSYSNSRSSSRSDAAQRTNLGHVDTRSYGDDYGSSGYSSSQRTTRRQSAGRTEVDYYDNRPTTGRTGSGRASASRAGQSRYDTSRYDTARYSSSRTSARYNDEDYRSSASRSAGRGSSAGRTSSYNSGASRSAGASRSSYDRESYGRDSRTRDLYSRDSYDRAASSERRRTVAYEEDYDYRARNKRETSARQARDGRGSRAAIDARSTRSAQASRGGGNARRDNGRVRDSFERGGISMDYAQPKRRGGKLKYVIAAVLILLVVGVGAAFAYTNNVNNNLHAGLDTEDLSKYLVETDLTNEPFYMLLMGTDGSSEREADSNFGGAFRTDSIILARIDPVEKKVSMVSIHRDTMVDMGEHGMQKINSAHMYGGPSLSVQVISQMAGVDISHYAEINFDGFKSIVDALGGVEVDVPVEINDEDAGGHLDAGLQTLNGEQALILCRSRYTYINSADPDSMRAANQRLVLSAIARKVLDSDIATIANTVTALSQYVTTDLEVSDIVGLAQAMRGIDTSTDIYTDMEPVDNIFGDDGIWYTYTNQEKWAAMMERMDAGLPPATVAEIDEATGTVIATNGEDLSTSKKYAYVSIWNGSPRSTAGDEAATLLENNGFVHVSQGAAPEDYSETWVIYDEDSQAYEAGTIVSALGQGRAVKNDGSWNFSGQFLVVIGSDWNPPDLEEEESE